MSLAHITSISGFESAIQSANLTVVDFYAVWCGPCKVLSPKLEALAKKYPSVRICKVDVDASHMSALASTYNISAMPTLVFFKRGREVDRVVGADVQRIEAVITKHK